MYLTDSIADMLTRIRNAASVKEEAVDVPASRVKLAIAHILKDEGFISKVESLTKRNRKVIRLTLKYNKRKQSVISEIRRMSTPGRRMYVGHNRLPRIKSGFGVSIISTSKGIMTDSEARKLGVGGEVICNVW